MKAHVNPYQVLPLETIHNNCHNNFRPISKSYLSYQPFPPVWTAGLQAIENAARFHLQAIENSPLFGLPTIENVPRFDPQASSVFQ